MNRATHCSSCGIELSEDAAPQGLCAACLLKLGLSSVNLIAEDTEPEPKREPVARRRLTALTIVGIGIAAVVLAWTALRFYRGSAGSPAATADVVRFSLLLGDPIDFAISPDGRRLAFTASDAEGKTALWLRPMNSLSPIPLPETEGAAAPFWSPDSRSVGFFARGKLRKVDIGSGVSVTLCDAPSGKSGAWSAAGVIVFARNTTGGLFRVPAHGGTPEPATGLAERNGIDASDRWPYFLPDGRQFLYTTISRNKQEQSGIFASSLDSREARRLVDVRSPAAFASDALLFVRDGILQVQAFDPSTLEFRTDARSFPSAEQVDWFSLSQSGTLVYRNLKPKSESPLMRFDRTGRVVDAAEGLTGSHFSISPDGRFVAVSRSGDIWISDLTRGVISRLTFDPAAETFPLWSPTGNSVAFISDREGKKGIYRKMTNGMNPEELLFEYPLLESIESWSPDDRFILYTSFGQNGKSQNGILPITGDRKPIPLQSAFNTRQGRFSPDGRWLAYVSDESGADEVYLETFPAGGGKWRVSVDGGTNPRWPRDGRELFYVSKQRNLMAVPIRVAAGSVEFSAARSMFRLPFEAYDVAGDDLFLLPAPAENGPAVRIDVVINWTSEIEWR